MFFKGDVGMGGVKIFLRGEAGFGLVGERDGGENCSCRENCEMLDPFRLTLLASFPCKTAMISFLSASNANSMLPYTNSGGSPLGATMLRQIPRKGSSTATFHGRPNRFNDSRMVWVARRVQDTSLLGSRSKVQSIEGPPIAEAPDGLSDVEWDAKRRGGNLK